MDKYSCFLILLGGTGAKCGEIFLHMCANGCFNAEDVTILFIDSDSQNGNARYFKQLHQYYEQCRDAYRIDGKNIPYFFRPKVILLEEDPVGKGIERFRDQAAAAGGASDRSAIDLMKALYSKEEMDMKISEGFFAHPNVGAAVFAANMEKIMEELLRRMESEKRMAHKIKVFILGSVFGGTGAASLPTIARYLRKTLFSESDNKLVREQMKVGGCMMLPYFLFTRKDENGNPIGETNLSVEADKFATKTRSALEYYRDEDGIFDELYILGHDGEDIRGKYSTEGSDQRNLPHIAELYAAMSAVRFFENDLQERGHYFAVIPDKKIGWADVCRQNGARFLNFLTMMRFSVVMKSLIMEELFDYTQGNKLKPRADKISWYYDFLDGKAESADMDPGKLYDKFEAISNYCDAYIRWFAELNLKNVFKVNKLEKVEYEREESDGSDIVEYLNIFSSQLLLKQYLNNKIWKNKVDITAEDSRRRYEENLEYIRREFIHLEPVHFYTDQKTESITMGDIWSRLSYIGYNMMMEEDDFFRNIAQDTNKNMDSGVRNLVNAVFCCCLI